MNRVFAFLVFTAFVVAGFREVAFALPDGPAYESWKALADLHTVDGKLVAPMDEMTNAAFDNAKKSVELVLKLIGGTALFLGLMKVVEAGGGLAIVAKLIRPILVRLFPDVPPNHPAMGAIIMNLAANALGLGNAATPFGIKAMHELEKLNPHKGTATDAMALFLTINTSGVTLLATGVFVIRRELGSHDPGIIFFTTLFATSCSTIFGTAMCLFLRRFFPAPAATNPIDTSASEEADDGYPMWLSVLAIGSVMGFFLVFMPSCLLMPVIWPGTTAAAFGTFFVQEFVRWLIPGLIVSFLGFGVLRGVAIYEVFVLGAREAFDVMTRIIPYLVAVLVAVGLFTSSGALDVFSAIVGPVTSKFGLPAEALPMALIRPMSGSGASGVMVATMTNPATGPDTYTGYLVSTIQGSTETTFYVLSVYYGAIGIQRIRHTLPAALFAEVCGIAGAIIAVQAYFRLVLGQAP